MCFFVCGGFLNCFLFCVSRNTIWLGEEFFSFHRRRYKERLSVVVTQCATRDGQEKKMNCVFLLFSLLNFACVVVRKIEFFPV